MVAVDGGSTSFTVDVQTVFAGGTGVDTGWEQAALFETALQGSSAGDANMRVAYDSENDTFVVSDVLGRALDIQSFTSNLDSGTLLKTAAISGQANKNNDVNTSTDAVSGVMTQAAALDLKFSQDTLTSTAFTLNGTALTSTSFNFDTDSFSGSTFQTNLDSMMTTLNAGYDGSPISYSMDADTRTISITHANGGELKVSGLSTSNSDLTIAATVTAGIGTDTDIAYYEALTSASIEGDGTVDGVATASTSTSTSTTSTTGISQISISTQDGANSALASIDAALETVLNERSMLGALENRLDHTINNLSNISTNTSAAKSRILDADFATETANLTKSQILSQAATSMLAQANQSKQSILALLQ